MNSHLIIKPAILRYYFYVQPALPKLPGYKHFRVPLYNIGLDLGAFWHSETMRPLLPQVFHMEKSHQARQALARRRWRPFHPTREQLAEFAHGFKYS